MWQRLLPLLLVVSAVGTLASGGVSPRLLRPALAAHRTILTDPEGWALVRGPLGDRPQTRIDAASRSVREARRPALDDPAIFAHAHWVSGLPSGARPSSSRVLFDTSPFRRNPVSRAPPGLTAPLF